MKNIVIFGMLGLIVGAGGMFAYFFFSPTPTKAVETAAVEPLRQEMMALENNLQALKEERQTLLNDFQALNDKHQDSMKLNNSYSNHLDAASEYTQTTITLLSKNAFFATDCTAQMLKGWVEIDNFELARKQLLECCNNAMAKADALSSIINNDVDKFDNMNKFAKRLNVAFISSSAKAIRDSIEAFKDLKMQEFNIYANEDWKTSDIKVSKGDLLFIDVKGKIRLTNRNIRDDVWAEANVGTNDLSDFRRYNVGTGVALMRVRGGVVRPANTKGNMQIIQADANGALEFTVNDTTLSDNSGAINISVIVINRKAWDEYTNSSSSLIK